MGISVEESAKKFALGLVGDNSNVYRVVANNVYGNKWRVNVFKRSVDEVGQQAALRPTADVMERLGIPHSFFLKYDDGAFTVVA